MKGFTLIELLAVIVILGIILLVAVPIIGDLIENTKINSVVSSNKMLMKGLDTYIMKNDNVLPNNIGDTVEIALQDLIDGKYIRSIKSPYNNNNCTGYILITKIEDGYIKTPHINCFEEVNGREEDSLVLHYAFDDFQEPTENLFYSPYIGEGTHQTTATLHMQRNINELVLSNDEYTLSGEFWRNQLHNGRIYGMFSLVDSSNNLIPGNAGLVPGWNSMEIEPLYDYFDSNIKNNAINNWYFYQLPKIKIPSGYDNGIIQWVRFTLTSGGTASDVTKIRNAQFEKKGYSTPFVDGIREGVVTDYSGNNNTSTLSLVNTPRWIKKDNDGVYKFDGEKTHISLPSELVPVSKIRTDGVTYSAWVNLSEIKEQRIVGQQIANGYSDYSSGGLGIDSSGRPQMIAYSDSSPSAYVRTTADTVLEIGKWYHLVGVFDPEDSNIKIYVNGQQEGEAGSIGTFSRLQPNQANRIGNKDHVNPYNFSGFIDEVKIYSKNLNKDEIKIMYELSK